MVGWGPPCRTEGGSLDWSVSNFFTNASKGTILGAGKLHVLGKLGAELEKRAYKFITLVTIT